jgi:FkbM family methyltransferase
MNITMLKNFSGPNNDKHFLKYMSGDYLPEVNNYIQILSKYSDPIYVDVGSNIGYFAVSLAPFSKEVHCFEPVSYLYDFLCSNTGDITNIITNKLGISNENKLTEIILSSAHHQGSTIDPRIIRRFKKVFENSSKETIGIINLYDYINNKRIQEIHLLKLDCEGMEYMAILGLKEKIDIVKNIVFESFFEEDIQKIKKYVEKYGFYMTKFYGIGGPMFLLTKE